MHERTIDAFYFLLFSFSFHCLKLSPFYCVENNLESNALNKKKKINERCKCEFRIKAHDKYLEKLNSVGKSTSICELHVK